MRNNRSILTLKRNLLALGRMERKFSSRIPGLQMWRLMSVLPEMFKATYESITKGNPMWNQLQVPSISLYSWNSKSTYNHGPPCFKNMTMTPPGPHGVKDTYCLLNFGDNISTDHISSTGSIPKDSPATKYLIERGVERKDFNYYGSRCGNDEVIARGTFANIRLVNKFLKGEVRPKTVHIPTEEKLSVFDAAMRYKNGHDIIILAGVEYGNGTSHDWAAKGPMLQYKFYIDGEWQHDEHQPCVADPHVDN